MTSMKLTESKKGIYMSSERYQSNPFLENMVVPVRGKKVRLSALGADDNVLINQSTGESLGTHVTTIKRVDNDQFVKLFTANIALTFELNSAGIKCFTLLMWVVQHRAIGKDQVDLDKFALEEFLAVHTDPPLSLSLATFKRGIVGLEKARIIAKTMRPGRYYINPNFVFNGDRIAFTTLIERQLKAEDQQELDL